MANRNFIFAFLAGALFLPGCFLAPKYKRPDVETPPAFKEQAAAVSPSSAAATGVEWKTAKPGDAFPRGAWWEFFGDSQLNQLELKVAVSNQNVKQAEAQYREAQALVRQAQAAWFPTLSAQPSAIRSFGPNNISFSRSNAGTTNQYELPLAASWEPDLWGAVAFAVRTEKAAAQASAAQLQGMLLSMQAELAADYFTLQSTDMQLSTLDAAVKSYEEALKLTQARFASGVASQADIAQSQAQLDQTRAQATDLNITRAQTEHAIAVLIGQAPSTFSLPAGRIQNAPRKVPMLLPSQLLERRPDVASAERLIVAANGQIGLARAAYFPALSLSASGGYESINLSNLLTWPSRFWSLGATATETILDFGRRRAVSQQAYALYDAQVAAYRQTVLAAFQEVEDNLAAQRLLEQEAAQTDSATKAAEDSLQLVLARYKAGTASYLDVITAQNIALTNERASAQILGRRMTAAVTLIRAIGGGWDTTQLPWPHNMESPPVASTAPVTTAVLPK